MKKDMLIKLNNSIENAIDKFIYKIDIFIYRIFYSRWNKKLSENKRQRDAFLYWLIDYESNQDEHWTDYLIENTGVWNEACHHCFTTPCYYDIEYGFICKKCLEKIKAIDILYRKYINDGHEPHCARYKALGGNKCKCKRK